MYTRRLIGWRRGGGGGGGGGGWISTKFCVRQKEVTHNDK